MATWAPRSARTLRVLFLTCHLPYPPVSGGRLREFQLLRRLSPSVDFHVVAVSKTPDEDREHAPALEPFVERLEVYEAANGACVRPGAEQVRIHRCDVVAARVRALVEQHAVDLVHVEGFYLMQHVPDPCACPVVLVEQNVEYTLAAQRLAVETDAERLGLRVDELRRTSAEELRAWRRSDLVGVLTEDDRAVVLAADPRLDVRLVPDGVDHAAAPSTAAGEAEQPTVVLVANYGYEPNRDAARFLCREIVPRVAREVPDVRFLLVGNAPPAELRAMCATIRHVDVTGRVPAVEPYLDAAHVVVAPLRVGGGVKVKVLEALARGRPTVATSVAAQGLGPGADRAMVIADDPAEFAAAVVRLLNRSDERLELARSAAAFARTLPTWSEAAESLLACYRALVRAGLREASSVA